MLSFIDPQLTVPARKSPLNQKSRRESVSQEVCRAGLVAG